MSEIIVTNQGANINITPDTYTLSVFTGGYACAQGNTTEVQYNNGGVIAGANGLTYNSGTQTTTIANLDVTGTANLGSNADVIITGGNSGEVLTTDGSGGLSWTEVANANFAAFAGNIITANQPNITNVGTLGNLTVSSNVTASFFIGNGSQLTGIGDPATISNGNSNVRVLANSDVIVSVAGNANVLVANGTGITVNRANLGAVANLRITGGNNGFVLQTDGTGNLSWTAMTGNAGNGTVGGSNTQIQYNDAGAFGGSAGLTFNKTTNAMATPGNITANGNIAANFFIGDGSQLTNVTITVANISNGNSNVAVAGNAGNVTMSVNGTANVVVVSNTLVDLANANLTLGNGVITGNGSGLSAIAGANVTGTVANATHACTANTVTNAAQSNITSLGTLTGLGVNGNITAANITANTGVITGNGNGLSSLQAGNIVGIVANANYAFNAGNANIANTVTNNAQPNITSVGTLTNLTVTGNVTAANLIGNLIGGIANGNSNIRIFANADITFSPYGVSNAIIFGGGIINLPISGGNSINAAGNIIGANMYANSGTIGALTVKGEGGNISNIQGANVNGTVANAANANLANNTLNFANGTSNIRVYQDSDIAFSAFGVANVISVGGGTTIFKQGSGNSIQAAGNIRSNTNIVGNILESYVATGTAPIVVASNTKVTNLNADLLDGYDTATANTANTIAVRDTNGNLYANYFLGNGALLTGIDPASISNGNSNVRVLANSNIVFASNGTDNVLVISNTNANLTGTLNVSGNANLTGTLNVSGNANVGNIGAINGVFTNVSGNGANLSSITGANVTGTVANANSTNNLNLTLANNLDNTYYYFPLVSYATTSNIQVGLYPRWNPDTQHFINPYIQTFEIYNNNGLFVNMNPAHDIILFKTSNITEIAKFDGANSSANFFVANSNLGNAARANFFIGDGGFISNITTAGSNISNGNSNVSVNANSNVTISVAGNSNIIVITDTGANINGTLIATTVNVTTVNSGLLQNGNSNITIAANGNISISTIGTANIITISNNLINIANANLTLDNGIITGNGSGLTNVPASSITGNVANANAANTANYINITSNSNTSGTFYPVFVSNTGQQLLYVDEIGNTFTYNPNAGELRTDTFVGTKITNGGDDSISLNPGNIQVTVNATIIATYNPTSVNFNTDSINGGNRILSNYARTTARTVANLANAVSILSGTRAFVSDSNVVASGNFGNIVYGGGSNVVPVYSDGTDWRIG